MDKDIRNQLLFAVVSALIGTFIVGLPSVGMAPHLYSFYAILGAVTFGILGWLFSDVLFLRKYIRSEFESYRENHKNEHLLKTAPLSWHSRSYHDLLERIGTDNFLSPTHRWQLAKFVSYKIGKDFSGSSLSYLEPSSKDYSDMLNHLIREAESVVQFTFPYTPNEWIVKFSDINGQSNPCSLHCSKNTTNCPLLKDHKFRPNNQIWLPPHLKAIKNSKACLRERIVTKHWENNDFKKPCAIVLKQMSIAAGIITQFSSASDMRDINILDDIGVVGVDEGCRTRVTLHDKGGETFASVIQDLKNKLNSSSLKDWDALVFK